jgi:hypothetical protein
MKSYRFDALLRAFTTSRRVLLRGTLAVPAGWLGVGEVAARKKRNKRKKLKRNSFGCVDVGQACRGNSANCCSSICEGNKPKKGNKDKSRCAAHNVLDCQAGWDGCLESGVTCGMDGICWQTTGKASFCGTGDGECFACTKDVDCEPDFGLGAACTVCDGACAATGGLICRPAAV